MVLSHQTSLSYFSRTLIVIMHCHYSTHQWLNISFFQKLQTNAPQQCRVANFKIACVYQDISLAGGIKT